MSKNELTPEVLTKLENAALGTLAKKSKEGDAVAASAEFMATSTLRQKYAYKGGYEAYAALAQELLELVEGQ